MRNLSIFCKDIIHDDNYDKNEMGANFHHFLFTCMNFHSQPGHLWFQTFFNLCGQITLVSMQPILFIIIVP